MTAIQNDCKSGAHRPPVAVIVTNFNYADYIEACLDSVLSQNEPPQVCVVVDDASTDGSQELIRAYIEKADTQVPLKLVEREVNGGQMAAMSDGLALVDGADFVVFVDSDDVLFEDFIHAHVDAHLNRRYPAALSCSNEVIIDDRDSVIARTIEKWEHPRERREYSNVIGHYAIAESDDWQYAWQFGESPHLTDDAGDLLFVSPSENVVLEFLWSTTSGIMFRKSILDIITTGPFDELRVNADYYLLHFAHLIGGSLLIQRPHGFYRRHSRNNFATAPILGRGTRAGTFEAGLGRVDLIRMIEAKVMDSYEEFHRFLGTPRLLQLLAIVVPLRRAWGASVNLGRHHLSLGLGFLALKLASWVKRALLLMTRAWRFV